MDLLECPLLLAPIHIPIDHNLIRIHLRVLIPNIIVFIYNLKLELFMLPQSSLPLKSRFLDFTQLLLQMLPYDLIYFLDLFLAIICDDFLFYGFDIFA